MVGKRIAAADKTVLFVILKGLKLTIRTPFLQKDPQTIEELRETIWNSN